MGVHKIKRGLDLPISGAPEQTIHDAAAATWTAVVGADHPGLRARIQVAEGDAVRRGQLLFEDRKTPGVRYTAPGAGRVAAINRGARRALVSVVIQLSESESERGASSSDADHVAFEAFRGGDASAPATGDAVRALLVESGLWTALRTRPYSKVPDPATSPHALFVNAMDTQPHAPSPEVVIAAGGARADFERGLKLLAKLTSGSTYLCVAAGSGLAGDVDAPVTVEHFQGPHPAGTTGVHIHTLAPASRNRIVWSIGYQDVIAVGQLFESGRLPVERVVSLAGPSIERPRLLRTRLGASTDDLVRGELKPGSARVISGSVLSGRKAMGSESGYLGRYDNQLSALGEGHEREFLGWARPGGNQFSVIPVFVSRLFRGRTFDFTTNIHGSPRAIVPIGLYERVMPMDILPTYLLRALVVGDLEQAEKLGALELDEEDLALCTFVCTGKTDYGPILRHSLERLEKEG